MPIHNNKKLMFVHVPRTGGTSIEKALDIHKPECMFSYAPIGSFKKEWGNLFEGEERCKLLLTTPQHLTAHQLSKIIPNEFESFYKFAVVRNPYDRLVSEYHHVISNTNPRWHDLRGLDFPEFIQTVFSLPPMIRHAIFDGHFQSQSEYLYHEGKLLVDEIFYFENPHEIWDFVGCESIHERKSDRKPWHEYYDEHLYAFVHEIYKDDFRNLHYQE